MDPPSSQTPHNPPPPSPFSPSTCTLITQGAEALLYRTTFLTSPPSSDSIPAALKFRPSKPYRHEILDRRLTRQRVLAEARVLVKLSSLRDADSEVKVPGVLGIEWDVGRRVKGLGEGIRGATGVHSSETTTTESGNTEKSKGNSGAWLLMEWIDGSSVKELLRQCDLWLKSADPTTEQQQSAEEEIKNLLRRVGRAVGAMHSKGGVVHGDLTSSNIMVRPVTTDATNGIDDSKPQKPDLAGEIVLIDFGLATQSVQDEDRAVDLYVLERAFGSTHPKQEDWFDQEVLRSEDGYKGSFKGSQVVLKRLEEVRLRGRKRSMVG